MCKSIDLALVARNKGKETNIRKIFRDYDFLRYHYLDDDTRGSFKSQRYCGKTNGNLALENLKCKT